MVFITSTKGTWRDDRTVKVRAQIDDCAHKQAAGAASFGGDTLRIAVAEAQ